MASIIINLQYGEMGAMNYLSVSLSGTESPLAVPMDVRTTMRRLFRNPQPAFQIVNNVKQDFIAYTHIVPNIVDYRGGYVQVSLCIERNQTVAPNVIYNILTTVTGSLFADKNRLRKSIEGTDANYREQIRFAAQNELRTLQTGFISGKPVKTPSVKQSATSDTFFRTFTTDAALVAAFADVSHPVFAKTSVLTLFVAPATFLPVDNSKHTINAKNIEKEMSTAMKIICAAMIFVVGFAAGFYVSRLNTTHEPATAPTEMPQDIIVADTISADTVAVDSIPVEVVTDTLESSSQHRR